MKESDLVRKLILSSNPDNIELGLIMNLTFKYYPLTAKFYKKNAKKKFWQPSRYYSVIETENRYYSWVALLNNELKTHRCYFWLDFREPKFKTPWQAWQQHITSGAKWAYNGPLLNYPSHPYTSMFMC